MMHLVRRFEVLDVWRGLGALVVMVFHLDGHTNWSLHGAAFLINIQLLLDFFFVLSGFVVTAAYEDKLASGYGVGPYALRRLMRIYPLHLATLAALIVYFALRAAASPEGFDVHNVFDGWRYSAHAVVTNALLLHGVGLEPHFTWNYPSWSISAEVYTYLIFALVWAFTKGASRWVALAMFVLGLGLMTQYGFNLTIMALVRCVVGFAAGMLVRHLFVAAEGALARTPAAAAHAAELVVLGVWFWLLLGEERPYWLAAPFFSVAVFVFAWQRGFVSQLVRTPALRALGDQSYSIYMLHAVVILFVTDAVAALETSLGTTLTVPGPNGRLMGTETWIGDLTVLALLAVVVALSALTFRYIERPGRAWGQKLSDQWRRTGEFPLSLGGRAG